MSEIHPTAIIGEGARLGQDVSLGPFSYVAPGAVVGDGCVIGPHVTILEHTTVGPRCRIHAGAVLGDLPQDLAYEPTVSYVRIGADCVIREGVTVHRGTKAGTATEVGDKCFLMGFSHCAHNVRLGRGVMLANGALLAGYVDVGDGAFISGNAVVHQFVRIGRLAMLGGNSGVSQDVLPFMTVGGLERNRVAGPNVVGLRRAKVDAKARLEIKRAFRLLCDSRLGMQEALQAVREQCETAEAEEICIFAEAARRGFCRARTSAEPE